MRMVFMGTPDFAAKPLSALVEHGYEVVLCITQPDKPKGRSDQPVKGPVKLTAMELGIPVFQPKRLRDEAAVKVLKEANADLFVVAAFGQILSPEVLAIPRLGCINIHASLLPKYRGASPIQQAILDGEELTGITIQQMDAGIDTGDILYRKELPIAPTETGGSLFEKLTNLGAEALLELLPLLEAGKLTPQKQDERMATHVGKITKETGRINWEADARVIERYVRGLNPWPSAYTALNGKLLKLWKTEVTQLSEKEAPGTILGVTKESFTVACGTDALAVYEVQLEGKKRMAVRDFLLGNALAPGLRLGEA